MVKAICNETESSTGSCDTDCEDFHKIIQKRKLVKKAQKSLKIVKEEDLDQILSSNEETVTTEEYFKQVHEFFKTQNKKNPQTKNRMKEYLYEKICEVCRDIKNDDLLLLCDYCDDAYHTYCLQPKLNGVPKEEVWACPICLKEKNERAFCIEDETTQINLIGEIPERNASTSTSEKKRQTILEEHYEVIKPEKEKKLDCKKCERMIKNLGEKEFCTKCLSYFHKNCFPKKKNSILCKECIEIIKDSIPPKNESILKYFSNKSSIFSQSNIESSQTAKNKVRSKSKKRSVLSLKRKKTFKLPKYTTDKSFEIELKHNLLFALKAKDIDFDDDLRYSNSLCSPQQNQGGLEPSLQKMDKETLKIFQEFKDMSNKGNYVPVMIEPDKTQGFFVRAVDDIPEMTLISEYVGDVDFARNRIFDKNDSIMDLLRTTRSKTSLVICPEKYGNLARFLSGINNSAKNAKKKQNVQSIRFNIEGHARVILFAKRNIKKGEILCYDYNEGCFDEYPTENFV